MKKMTKIVISLLLLVSIAFSFASCELLHKRNNESGRKYTGGFHIEDDFYDNIEIHWVETFEEAMMAIEHLEATGITFLKTAISSYENETVDAKYCFVLDTYKSKRLKKGQEWYDREGLRGASVCYYGFLDKVTIEKIEYSWCSSYRHFTVAIRSDEKRSADNLVHKCSEIEDHKVFFEENSLFALHEDRVNCWGVIKSSNSRILEIEYNLIDDHLAVLPADFHDVFLKTIVVIGEPSR